MNDNIIQIELAAKELAEINTNTEVKMHSKECEIYRASHENCHGCQYELACNKMVGLLLATMTTKPQRQINRVLESDRPQELDFDFDDDF